jgi:hypothetical protein
MNRRAFLAALILTPAFCFAWGGEGHQIVALIAENHLTPKVKAAIADLLGPDVHISDAEVASWADEIRRQERDTADWHYVNVRHDASAFDRKRDGRKGENVIDKLTQQAAILADKSQPKERRAEALKWVVHLAGDIHQPLHCADRNGDKGGNKRLVFFLDRREAVNLHSVWDTWIVRQMVGKQKIAVFADALDKKITPKQRNEWSAGTPEQWANESHRVAVEKVYSDMPEDGPPQKLGREYVASKVPVVAEQLERASTRLAHVLNKALSAK